MQATGRLLRLVLVLALTFGAVLGTAGAASAATYAGSEESFAAKINAERKKAGLGNLAVDVQLTRVARNWSGVMSSQDTLYHNPKLATQVLGDWRRLGENVGFTRKTGAPEAELVDRLHAAFMASPGHRANVLGNYNQAGVGVTIAANGKMWVTVVFAHAPLPKGRGQINEGVKVSKSVFAAATSTTGRKAKHVVVGRADVFADTLAGSSLAGDLGPILLTPGPSKIDANPTLHPSTRAEIDRVLGGKGTVYLLGGVSAVSDRVGKELAGDGYRVRRIAGANRVETAVKVARETVTVRGNTGEVLIARSDDWADAVAGGAYAAHKGSPILLTNRASLSPEVAAYLAELKPTKRTALGGPVALSDAVVRSAGANRVAGANRYATSVEISRRLWGRTSATPGDAYVSAHGATAEGWAYALVQTPRAAAKKAPQLLVANGVPVNVSSYLSALRYRPPAVGGVDASSNVSASVVNQLRQLVGA
jgi:uncharacterized protein YkwD/putative cell wall-binding protein